MPSKRYALEPKGEPRLEVSWKWNYKDVVVKLDGFEVGRIDTPQELKLGRTFALIDGSTLHVQLADSLHRKELLLTRNGVPLPGSSGDPDTVIKTAAGVLGVVAAISGALAIYRWSDGGGAAEMGAIIEAALFGVLAWRVLRRSLIALWIAIVLYAVETIFTILSIPESGGAGAHGIVMRIIVFAALIRAHGAIRSLREKAPAGLPPVRA